MKLTEALKNTVGVIPAAGEATRISPIPCSKEIFPIGFHSKNKTLYFKPKAVCSYLMESMVDAGITKAFYVVRNDKHDIIKYLGNGKSHGLRLSYISIDFSPGVPFSINKAYHFVKNFIVVLGFPDIIIHPQSVFTDILKKLHDSQADIVLGLFPASKPSNVDMVKFDNTNSVQGVYPKPNNTSLRYTWLVAAWRPSFTEYLKTSLDRKHPPTNVIDEIRELYLGDVIHHSIQSGMDVKSVLFPKGYYLDIGTPEDLQRAITIYSNYA